LSSALEPFFTALVAGTGVGCIYALVAISYNLVYSATGVFNFAQGALFALGGLVAYSLIVTYNLPLVVVIVLVMLIGAFVAVVQERVSVAPFMSRGGDSLAWVITTLGASIILENGYQLIWGSQTLPVPTLVPGAPLHIWTAPIPISTVVIVVTAVTVAGALELWSTRTLGGKAWQATAEDPESAVVRGINIRRVGSLAFLASGAIAGIGGMVTVPVTAAVFNAGALISLQGFVAIVLGGFGSQKGALVGGILLGIAQSEAVLVLDVRYTNLVALAILLAVLLFRPAGLFGVQTERQV
jgi:branched-chain amino acid transport system permease protein